VIKANDKVLDSSGGSRKNSAKITDRIEESESVLMNHDQIIVNKFDKKVETKHQPAA